MIKSLTLTLLLSGAGVLITLGAESGSPPAMAWHFVGFKALKASSPDAVFNELGGLKNSELVGGEARGRLTEFLPGWFGLDSTKLSADVIAPLIAESLEQESAARFEGDHLTSGDWVVAVQFAPGGADRWQSALLTVGRRLGLGEPAPLKIDGLAGWELPGRAAARGFAFLVQRDWVLFASGFKINSPGARWAASLAKDGRPLPQPGNDWLAFELHPAAVNWHPSLPFAGPLAHINSAFSWQKKDIRTIAKLTLTEDRKAPGAAWQIPKGIANDPLVSFTAVRNLQKFFAGLDPMKGLNSGLIPDQWFGWSRSSVAFIDDFAVPVNDGEKVFDHLTKTVPATYNPRLLELALGQWLSATNNARVLWRGLPLLVPYFGPKKDGSQDFIQGGIFPLTEQTNATPAPAELFAQFESRNELVYYDWEISPARLAAYKQMSQFLDLFLPSAKAEAGTYGAEWLAEIQPKLGNVITEVAVGGPRELVVTRRSQVGMTGIELWLFTHWLDSETFPKFPYSMPKRPTPGARPAGLPGATPPGQP